MLKTFSKTVKTLPLLAVMGALVACGARANVVESGTWFETAYAVWIAPNNTEQFRVETRLNNGDWLAVDTELVRQINTATHTWRVDVPGLRNTAGSSYSLRILNAANNNVLATVNNLVATPFDRQGYAFSPNSVNGLTTTTGGYNEDGTVRADAEIIYVTHQNMNQVLNSTRFPNAADANPTPNGRPLILRFIGQVGTTGARVGDYSDIPQGATVATANINTPQGQIQGRVMHMLVIRNGQNITIEGIGTDARIEGWGIRLHDTSNVVVRNMHFDKWFDDGIHLQGNNNHTSSHTWIHHNWFGYGQDRYNAGLGEPDHIKGDGATDITSGATHFTVAFNRYDDSGKSMLTGGGNTQLMGHGTIHHNWFFSTDERTPRLRNGWVHVFNNIYEEVGGEPGGGSGYGIGAGHRSNIVAEGNTFIHTFRPFIISGERSSWAAGPNPDGNPNTLSNDAPGIIVTTLMPNSAQLAGRTLEANVFDAWSMNPDWWFLSELESPTITNDGRGNGLTLSHTFIPFDSPYGFPLNTASGAEPLPAFNPPARWTPRAAISATVGSAVGSTVGVEPAAAGANRVRANAGPMR